MRNALQAFADQLAPPFREQFLAAISRVKADIDWEQIAAILATGAGAAWVFDHLDLWNQIKAEVSPVVQDAVERAVTQAGETTLRGGLRMRFDLSNPAAVRAVDGIVADSLEQIVAANQGAIRGLLRESLAGGDDPTVVARMIRQHIGLNEQQSRALDNYRSALEGQGLAASIVESRALRYSQQLLSQRATMITRTETVRALTAGQQAAWDEATAIGLLDKRSTKRRWIVDGAPCPEICAPMAGQVVEMDEPFIGGDGLPYDAPPTHPQCECAIGLVFEDQASGGPA